jgi:hypothetical protein
MVVSCSILAMNLACAVAHSHTLQCERLTIAFVCPPAPEPTSAAATLRVRRPREFADGLDDRIRRADAARVPNRQRPDGRAGVEPERTRRVCWLYVRRLATGALVAEFVPKSAVPPVPARLLLLCLLFRSSWRRVEGDRHVGAAGVLRRPGGRAVLAARVGVAPGVPKRLSRASRSADHTCGPPRRGVPLNAERLRRASTPLCRYMVTVCSMRVATCGNAGWVRRTSALLSCRTR